MPTVVLRYERDELPRIFQFGCLVEMWDHVVGRGSSGSKRRKYHEEFTPQERAYIAKWYPKFYNWYCGSGLPDYVTFQKIRNVHLLQRAIHFFATV